MHNKTKHLEALIQQHRDSIEVANSERTHNNKGSLINNKMAISANEFALQMGVSVRTVERILKRGEIAYKKVGRRVVIPVSAIETWLNRKE